MSTLLERLEKTIEAFTGRDAHEIRDTPICFTHAARRLRKRYRAYPILRWQHQLELKIHCAEYRQIMARRLPKKTREIQLLNLGIYYLRHRDNLCGCNPKKTTEPLS